MDQIRPFYDAARALYPLLPQWYEYTTEVSNNPEFRGLNAGGLPIFNVPPGYTLAPDEGAHEAGHAYLAILAILAKSNDYLALYWTFRGFPGTWHDALIESQATTGNAAWQLDPRESWAESFSCSVVITHNEKTMDYGKRSDPLALRAFFQSLDGRIAPIVPSVSAPTQITQPIRSGTTEWFGPIPASNFTVGREGNPTTLIVDHWMAGTLAAADARFKNPAERVSAHYGVTQDGRVVQWVSEADTAYHAGDWTKNTLSIGIEHEASPTMPPTDALYAASAKLHADIAARHNLTLTVGVTVLPHRAITATACPGTLDLDRIVREGGDMAFATDPDAIAYRKDVKDTFNAIKAVLATVATQNGVEDQKIADISARIDKLHAI